MGGDDDMDVDPPDPIVALRRPISGRGTRSMAAKEKERIFDSRLKSDRMELESVLPDVEPRQRPTSPTKREVQEDMKKAWSKIQTQSKNGDDNAKESSIKNGSDDAKNCLNGTSGSNGSGSDQNANEDKMDISDIDKTKKKQVRIITDDKTATQLKKRVHISAPQNLVLPQVWERVGTRTSTGALGQPCRTIHAYLLLMVKLRRRINLSEDRPGDTLP